MSPADSEPSRAGTTASTAGKIHPFFKASRPASERASSPLAHDLSDSSQTGSRKKRKTTSSKDLGPHKRKNTLEGPLLSLLKPQPPVPAEKEPNGLETPPALDEEGLEDAEGEIDDENPGFFPGLQPQATARTPSYSPSSTSTQGEPNGLALASCAATDELGKPSKILKFNMKTGTLGSPPKSKPKKSDSLEVAKPTRGRPRKTPKQLIATLHYGIDAADRRRIGSLIEQILSRPQQPGPASERATSPALSQYGTATIAPVSTASTPIVVPNNLTPAQTNKSTHPFFAKGTTTAPSFVTSSTATASLVAAKKPTLSLSTPCSPRRKSQPPASFGGGPSFGTRTKGMKVPGAQYPLFPPQDMVHVRCLDPPSLTLRPESPRRLTPICLPLRKAKQRATTVPDAESLITCLQSELGIKNIIDALSRLSDDFAPAPASLRVPKRHVESGRQVQARIRPQIRTPLPGSVPAQPVPIPDDSGSSSDDDLAVVSRFRLQQRQKRQKPEPPHPYIARLYSQLADGLSAYDRSQVLQSGREALLLKEWLEALKVNAVHTASADPKPKGKGPKKRGKKKKGKLDGFIIDENSDDDDGGAYSPCEDSSDDALAEWAPDVLGTKRSVARTVAGRLRNAIVLSGKHGVGKTATVYAAAKELGFEVFEINAASRRAGKDILEKVGDMTRNHLVQRQAGETGEASSTASKSAAIASFFGKKTADAKDAKDGEGKKDRKDKEPAAQKQSLILIEEADLLYDEDKNFWATLVTLMSQAKRPFVITCNDETLIPLHTLPLHAIFRLRTPPREASLDALVLIAACEGHVLHRQAIGELWASREGDLRAALAELQFWCQFGVGDVKGGFDWLLARWPTGSDVNEHGETLRVVSEGVYEGGMGWLSRDSIAQGSENPEAAVQCWEDFGIDLYDWGSDANASSVPLQTVDGGKNPLAALEAFSDSADSMSLADVRIDPTIPEMPLKRREDFILGRTLLEADPMLHYSTLTLAIPAHIKAFAQKQRPPSSDAGRCPTAADPTLMLKNVLSRPAPPPAICRPDYSAAFDPIAASSVFVWAAHVDPSVFDRPMRLIALDVAPYVRSIVYHDTQRRARNLSCSPAPDGTDRPAKKLRATRAALSAMDGGHRASVRVQDYFATCSGVDNAAVLATAGASWPALAYSQYQSAVTSHAAWFAVEMERLRIANEERLQKEARARAEQEAQAAQVRQQMERQMQHQFAQNPAGMIMQIQPFIPPPGVPSIVQNQEGYLAHEGNPQMLQQQQQQQAGVQPTPAYQYLAQPPNFQAPPQQLQFPGPAPIYHATPGFAGNPQHQQVVPVPALYQQQQHQSQIQQPGPQLHYHQVHPAIMGPAEPTVSGLAAPSDALVREPSDGGLAVDPALFNSFNNDTEMIG
ncbi:Telomere length regulation protein elg1 [Ceratocystis lukuohia]|uniref:Telomere length regulation protein elg1 n=1 Tax=Ceratocystis lukuohia TaxID=2019550 RepID=A0ABR4MJI9_9PEZI